MELVSPINSVFLLKKQPKEISMQSLNELAVMVPPC